MQLSKTEAHQKTVAEELFLPQLSFFMRSRVPSIV
jgi:hypothetical protein